MISKNNTKNHTKGSPIAIIGAGPAGSTAARFLADAGFQITLFDKNHSYEKPCGGGLTGKVANEFPELYNGLIQSKCVFTIDRINLQCKDIDPFEVQSPTPITLLSRKELNQYLLDLALSKGARYKEEKVISLVKHTDGYRVITEKQEYYFPYIIGADGAHSIVRKALKVLLSQENTLLCMGFFVPNQNDQITSRFLPGIYGYFWDFPRPDQASVGLCYLRTKRPFETARMKQLIENYVHQQYPDIPLSSCTPYFATIPGYSTKNKSIAISGKHWALIGDAAGLTDPITGEGIYYAIRSGEAAAYAMINQLSFENYHRQYMKKEINGLNKAAKYLELFYHPEFLSNFMQLHQTIPEARIVLTSVMSGNLHYSQIKSFVLKKFLYILRGAFKNWNKSILKRLKVMITIRKRVNKRQMKRKT